MSALTVRNLSPETHRALRARASTNNRSTEAEVRAILDSAVQPIVRVGSLLADIGAECRGVDIDVDRDRTSRGPLDFT